MGLIERVDFVLVEPSEGGNVGSCARALKNMGIKSLWLVKPKYSDHENARKLAVHALDLLERAKEVSSLDRAVQNANWVVGVSARTRKHEDRKPPMDPETMLKRLHKLPDTARVAFVFGPEKSGLSNRQLGKCQDILYLPTSTDYPSMNLAQAVAVVAWEIRKAELASRAQSVPVVKRVSATAEEIDGLVHHAKRTLKQIDYLNPQNPRLVLDDMRKVFSRAGLDSRETRMFRGIFHCMDVWISQHGGPPTLNQRQRRTDQRKSQKHQRATARDCPDNKLK